MAQKIILVDDLDGSTDGIFTVSFGIDKSYYEIDLTEENIARLWAIYEPYVKVARRAK